MQPPKAMEFEVFETPPPPSPKTPEPEKEIQPRIRTPREKLLPPPPNDAAPAEPTKPVPLVTGISMSSTTQAGQFAVPVGNTTYGKTGTARDPSEAKPYAAADYALPGDADQEPEVIGSEIKVPYPEAARQAQVQGTVRLKVSIDAAGSVTGVVAIGGPGYGLREAAIGALQRFRFRPAMKRGQPIPYTFIYAYTFELR